MIVFNVLCKNFSDILRCQPCWGEGHLDLTLPLLCLSCCDTWHRFLWSRPNNQSLSHILPPFLKVHIFCFNPDINVSILRNYLRFCWENIQILLLLIITVFTQDSEGLVLVRYWHLVFSQDIRRFQMRRYMYWSIWEDICEFHQFGHYFNIELWFILRRGVFFYYLGIILKVLKSVSFVELF